MGEVFAGRYELVDPVGHGGVGAVWRAWDHRRHRYVAAKVLQQSDAHSLLRFVREQALRIDHPHVLAPASWAADDDKVLFTMDLVGGGSLAHVIGDYGPLPPRFTCVLLDQLLSGLAAVHAEGVVHRDIKPANILLEATGAGRPHLRLSDFGISMRKGEPRLTETDYVVGTPGYFAPEQMLGAEPDFTADLFAVGLVALYLLEGAKPDARALIEHFADHGTPRAPRGMPEPLWQVIATLLQPDPQTRFRTATGARKALASAAEMLPEPGPDDELIEIFDQLAPLPTGFGPDGPLTAAPRSGASPRHARPAPGTGTGTPAAYTPPTGTPSGLTPSGPTPPAPSTPNPSAPPPSMPTPPGPASSAPTPYDATPPNSAMPGPASPDSATPGPASPSSATPDSTPSGPTPPAPFPPAPFPPAPSPSALHPSAPHPSAPQPSAPQPSAPLPAAPFPSVTSDTGSFPLPPPVQPPQPPTPPTPTPLPPQAPAPDLTHVPSHVPSPHQAAPHDSAHDSAQAVTSAVRRAPASTYPYTAQAAQVPLQTPLNPTLPQPYATAFPTPPRRPGPPAKVAVPMLLLALICLTVGTWALTQM